MLEKRVDEKCILKGSGNKKTVVAFAAFCSRSLSHVRLFRKHNEIQEMPVHAEKMNFIIAIGENKKSRTANGANKA